ncbi:phage integrase family protein [Methanocorpusculum labreanum Z]|uniref:Phage integrase family protein n=2 Tax=Methanocorpusculum labreanum TaxID=83984 RepID=A2SRK2_METLZ|nr:phage integrase family protein [Methanocorpusculum labreanum Z]
MRNHYLHQEPRSNQTEMAPPKRTFSIWIPRYLSNLQTKNYAENTIEAYGRILKLFATYETYLKENDGSVPTSSEELNNFGMGAEIDTNSYEIGDFFTLLRNERQLSPASLRQYDSALSSFYGYLINQDITEANPMTKVDRPKIKDRELKYLKHNEVVAFINSIENPRNALLIRTIYATGMRISEICGLLAEHIDFEEETIRVRGKGGKIRIVFCDSDTLNKIREHLNGKKSGPVFEGRNGNAISPRTVQHIFNIYAPPGITPHKIRHSYASELYKRSHNLRVVQENLGHNSIQTTEIYIHTDIDERRKAYRSYFPLANGE